ncbi:MAG: Dabb family protein [Roseiflexaceae bacterium]
MRSASQPHFSNSFGFSKKKPETDEATVQAIMERLEGLYGQIRGLMKIRCYRALPSDRPVAYTFLLDSSVTDADALAEYLADPAHIAVNEWMTPFLESRAVVDYEE